MSRDLTGNVRTIALLLAGSALISRLLGYGRDFLLNTLYGATELTDVYRASFAVPDMLNHLLAGGALTVSLLPRMAALYAKVDARLAARRAAESGENAPPKGSGDAATEADPEVVAVFSTVASTMLFAVVVGVVVAEIWTEPLVGLIVEGFDAEKTAETARLTRIVLPAQIFFIFGGLVQANLLARQRFGALALTPLLYNGGIIAGGMVGALFDAIEGFSWGALIGAFFGALVVPLVVARNQLRFVPRLPSLDREVRAFLWTATPLMIGVSLTTVDEWCGVYFGSSLEEGSISWLNSARRLMLVPIGLVGTAAGQATGAWIARLYAEGRRDELGDLLGRSVGAVAAMGLVVAAFAMAEAEPIVGMLFEHGRFGRADTLRTAAALVPMSAGIAAWTSQAVLTRAMYGVGDTWRPMLATTVVTALSLPMYSALAAHGVEGLALAGAIGMTAQVLVLTGLATRRLGLRPSRVGLAVARALPVAAVSGLAAWYVDGFTSAGLSGIIPAGTPLYFGRLAAAATAWGLVVIVLGRIVGLPGLAAVTDKVLARLPGRKRQGPS